MITRLRALLLPLLLLLLLAILFSPSIKAQTKINPNQISNIGSTYTGNIGTKYGTADAYRYVSALGNDSNDGLSPGTAFATPQHCNTVVIALGGGTCDARTLYSYTYGNAQGTIAVAQHNPPLTPVTLLLPPYGSWTCSVTGGAMCLEVFNGGAVIGTSSGQGNQFIITASATANVSDVCGTDPSLNSAYLHMEGFGCASQSGAVVSGAVIHIQQLVDLSRIFDLSSGASSTNTKSLLIENNGAGTSVQRVKGNGNSVTGNVPCTIGSNAGSDIGPISCTGSGSGKNALALVQGGGTINGGANIHDVYAEMNFAADTSTAVIGVTGTSGFSDKIQTVTFGNDAAGGSSTRCIMDIGLNASVIVRNIHQTNSTCAINDHNTGRGIVNVGASAVITDYSTENGCCGLAGYFTKPSMFGLTNNTGLQLFNTTTTCTTAASVGATCTTAAITLPVAEADTAYRVTCTGKGLTNVPTVIATTNSSATQFTITIAALTAAAASFASYDCSVGHN